MKWTFWDLPDSIKLRENQAENLSWNLVPRPISILCSPDTALTHLLSVTSQTHISSYSWMKKIRILGNFYWIQFHDRLILIYPIPSQAIGCLSMCKISSLASLSSTMVMIDDRWHDRFKCILLNATSSDIAEMYIECSSKWSCWWRVSIGLDDGFAPYRCHVIILTNADPTSRHISAYKDWENFSHHNYDNFPASIPVNIS